MLGHNLKDQLKSNKIIPQKKKLIYTSSIITNNASILPKSIKPTIKASTKPTIIIPSKRISFKHYPSNNSNTNPQIQTYTHTNIQSTLSSLNQFTPTNQHKLINTKPSHSNITNKQRISAASSIAKGKQGDYAKIFGLLNSEIREITDLFKRTQSVDQQTKKEEIIIKPFKHFNDNTNNNNILEDIDYVLFEKCLCEEEDKDEKVLDISNLEASDAKKIDSVLFSSYNSEFYRNLNKEDNEYDESGSIADISPSSIDSGHNVVKIAKANVFKNKHSRQKSASVVNGDDGSDKTECQFQDVVFNQTNNNQNTSFVSEKTCDMMNERERKINYVPIQEVMKQIRTKRMGSKVISN